MTATAAPPPPLKAHYMPSAREVNDELRLYFNRFDKNFSGYLEQSQAQALLRDLGVHSAQLGVFQKQFKADSDGRVSFESFKAALFDTVAAMLAAKSKDDLHKAFVRFDTDNDGAISGAEIQKLMDFLRIPAQAAKQFMATADRDADNRITFDEFAAVVRPSRM